MPFRHFLLLFLGLVVLLSLPALSRHQMHWDAAAFFQNPCHALSRDEFAERVTTFHARLAVGKALPGREGLTFAWSDPAYVASINDLHGCYYRYPSVLLARGLRSLATLWPVSPPTRIFIAQVALVLLFGTVWALLLWKGLDIGRRAGFDLWQALIVAATFASAPPFLASLRGPMSESMALVATLAALGSWRRAIEATSRERGWLLAAVTGVGLFAVLRLRQEWLAFAVLALATLALSQYGHGWRRIHGILMRAAIAAGSLIAAFAADGIANGWGLLPSVYAATIIEDALLARRQPDALYAVEALLLNGAVLAGALLLSARTCSAGQRAMLICAWGIVATFVVRMFSLPFPWEARMVFSFLAGLVVVAVHGTQTWQPPPLAMAICLPLLVLNLLGALDRQVNAPPAYCYLCEVHRWPWSKAGQEPSGGYYTWSDRHTVFLPDWVTDEAHALLQADPAKDLLVTTAVKSKFNLLPLHFGAGYRLIPASEQCARSSSSVVIGMIDGRAGIVRSDACTRSCGRPAEAPAAH